MTTPVRTIGSEWMSLHPDTIYRHLNELVASKAHNCHSHPLRLGPEAIAIHTYDTVASTNKTLWNLLHVGQPAGTVVIARQQSAGRGQHGRQWQSPLGGLYLSMALTPNCLATDAVHLTLSVAWGMAAALRTHQVPTLIKWPNDLVIPSSVLHPFSQENRGQTLYKLGGILTETRIQKHKINQAVVGIGINGANPVPAQGIALKTLWQQIQPAKAAEKSSWLNEELMTSLNGIAAIAIWGILLGWNRWQQDGIEAILTDYNALFSHRGQQIQIEYAGQPIHAQLLGVDTAGHLRLHPLPHSSVLPSKLAGNLVSNFAGTSSQLHSSFLENIRLAPSCIRLGYHLGSLSIGNFNE